MNTFSPSESERRFLNEQKWDDSSEHAFDFGFAGWVPRETYQGETPTFVRNDNSGHSCTLDQLSASSSVGFRLPEQRWMRRTKYLVKVCHVSGGVRLYILVVFGWYISRRILGLVKSELSSGTYVNKIRLSITLELGLQSAPLGLGPRLFVTSVTSEESTFDELKPLFERSCFPRSKPGEHETLVEENLFDIWFMTMRSKEGAIASKCGFGLIEQPTLRRSERCNKKNKRRAYKKFDYSGYTSRYLCLVFRRIQVLDPAWFLLLRLSLLFVSALGV